MREVQLGLGEDVLFWLDDYALMPDGECQKWIRYANYHCIRKNSKFILKSMSCTALAYLDSIFFKISISQCSSYKMI